MRSADGAGPTRIARVGPWTWLAVLAVGSALYLLVRTTLISTHDEILLPSVILLGAAVVPVSFMTFIGGRPLEHSLAPAGLAVVGLVSGTLGVVVAGNLEARLQGLPTAGYLLSAALVEEVAKLLVPVALLVLGRHRERADGLLIGAASGAGFAVLETMGYAYTALIGSNDDLHALSGMLLRGLLAPGTHMAWTALVAGAAWSAAAEHWTVRSLVRLVGVLAAVVGLHAGWDLAAEPWSYGAVAAASLALLFVAAQRVTTP